MKLQAYEVSGWEYEIDNTDDPGQYDYCLYTEALEFAKEFAFYCSNLNEMEIEERLKTFMLDE